MSLVEKLKSGCIQAQKRWSGDCGEMSLVDEHKTDAVMAEAAKKIEELQKTIDALRAEIKEARAVIRNAADTVKAFRKEYKALCLLVAKARLHVAKHRPAILQFSDWRELDAKLAQTFIAESPVARKPIGRDTAKGEVGK